MSQFETRKDSILSQDLFLIEIEQVKASGPSSFRFIYTGEEKRETFSARKESKRGLQCQIFTPILLSFSSPPQIDSKNANFVISIQKSRFMIFRYFEN